MECVKRRYEFGGARRPGLPSQTELTEERDKLGVFSVCPGITGLSQVSNIDMSTP